MLSSSAALVMLAIRSFTKLGSQLRKAYVDAAKQRELVLPLPNFFSKRDIVSAVNYFAGPGRAHVVAGSQLDGLLRKRQAAGQVLTADEEAQVQIYHIEFFNLDLARAGKLGSAGDGTALDARDFSTLITIRQWQRGADPNPSTLQRVAGTFIEIGIDYLTTVPGAFNKDSRHGKAVAGFLQAMSEIRFSERELGEIPGRLFIAALETLSDNGELLSGDAKVQELLRVTTRSLSTEVARRLDQIGDSDLVKKEHIADWTELVFRSVLSSAGGLVLSDPRRFLGIGQEDQATLVSVVGKSVLGLVVDDTDLHLDRLFSRERLEAVIKSSLTMVGGHPEILLQSGNNGLQQLLSSIAVEFSRFDTVLTPDLLPELMRLILEKTGRNLSLLWPDIAANPQRHLLVAAAATTLDILTRKPADGGTWMLRFGSADILTVADTVFDELTANPTWLLDTAGQFNDNLGVVLEAALRVVRNHADARLSPATVVAILRAVVLTSGQRKEFLEKMPGGAILAGEPLIAAAVDAVFRTVFNKNLDPPAAWQVVRNGMIVAIVNAGLAQLAKVQLSADTVVGFAAFIQQVIDTLVAGKGFDLPTFETRMQEALAA